MNAPSALAPAPDSAPPPRPGAVRRFAASCISTPANIALTAAIALLLALTLPDLVEWTLVKARFSGAGPEACRDPDGACWVFVSARIGQLLYGDYPPPERWRVDLVLAITAACAIGLMLRPVRRHAPLALALLWLGPALSWVLALGGVFGLPPVATTRWGGLALTAIVAATTLAGAIPLGLALALARRSQLPLLRWLAVATIELGRGVPLVAVLFVAMAVLPLLLPPGVELSPLLRAALAFVVFNAAGMAEVFRGGLQAVPAIQTEGARALGFTRLQILGLIELPQALVIAMPGLVNTAIAVIKETTVVLIIGLLDFLAQIQAGLADPQWIVGDQVRDAAYFFAGLVFWIVCFGLSRLSAGLERRTAPGR
ncbi:MAG TPA: amino acid ABC transporter permease [Alphaproteobacteria bacterium]|jgi:general L-amino acid transport system permease protein